MEKLCGYCLVRPYGNEGHDRLLLVAGCFSPPPESELFKCADCRALWVKSSLGPGAFAWQRMEGSMPAAGTG
jgi:hypothetical protein